MVASLSLVPLAFNTGCALTSGREGAKAYANDKTTEARIKSALYADPAVKGTEVAVTVLNGQVQLSGFVDTPQAKQRAEQIAADTPGVAKVFNDIIVGTTPTATGR